MLSKEIKNLSDAEKLRLISEIWETMENPDSIPVTDEQKKILDKRFKNFRENPVTHNWEDIKHLLNNIAS